ncbi:MAG: 2-dehydropantoate 2-reductase [Verrucomicrobiota bacterium]|jgi:2-dehydropantoate 2-reductase
MKIAVVGCGALGSFYGAKLCQAGHEVHFLLRSDYEAVRKNGVRIQGVGEDFVARPVCARAPGEIGAADLVLVCLKTTANHLLPQLLPPLAGPHTILLTLQNGLGNEAAIAAVAGADNTMGGLCFVCLNRLAPGLIRHIAHGAVVIGEYRRPPQPRTHRIAQIITQSGVRCKVADNLEQAHWEKLVWNIPFNGLGVAGAAGLDAVRQGTLAPGTQLQPCLTTDLLLSDPRWEELVRDLMLETIHTARALGLDVPEAVAERQIARTRQMGAYKASTLIDFERGQELELQGLFLEPLRLARQAGVPCPRLAALCGVLQKIASAMPANASQKEPA